MLTTMPGDISNRLLRDWETYINRTERFLIRYLKQSTDRPDTHHYLRIPYMCAGIFFLVLCMCAYINVVPCTTLPIPLECEFKVSPSNTHPHDNINFAGVGGSSLRPPARGFSGHTKKEIAWYVRGRESREGDQEGLGGHNPRES